MENSKENMKKTGFFSKRIPSDLWENFLEIVLKGVLNHKKLDAIKINNENFHCILGNALRHKSYHLTQKCEKFIEDRSEIYIDIEDFRKLRFNYVSGDNSLELVENKIIAPLIEIFRSYIGASPETHSIELVLTYREDVPFLEKFIEKYGSIIRKIDMVATDLMSDNLLFHMTKYCENLQHLKIHCFDYLSAENILSINQLSNLELLGLLDAPDAESLEVTDCKKVKVLELSRAEKIKNIHIKNMNTLRRLEISKCSNLEYLSVIDCPCLEEIFIIDCPKLDYSSSVQDHPNLKFCMINNKRFI